MASTAAPVQTSTTTWNIDPAHSMAEFKVKHMMIANVKGHFPKVSGALLLDEFDLASSRVEASIEAASIYTRDEQRDAHLKSADFFDAAKYAKMSFASTSVKPASDYELKVTGNLTMRGVTKEITLAVIYNGTVASFDGSMVAGFEIRTRLNRFDFGLQWNAVTEAGGIVVSNEEKVEILAEFKKAEAIAKAA